MSSWCGRLRVTYTAWNGARGTPSWCCRSGTDRNAPGHPARHLAARSRRHGGGERTVLGGLPAFGPFAVVNPEGQGRSSPRARGVARPDRRPRPDAQHPARQRSRGSTSTALVSTRSAAAWADQETLLLTALHPKLLTAAAPLDSATDMAARYKAFATTPGRSRSAASRASRDRRNPHQRSARPTPSAAPCRTCASSLPAASRSTSGGVAGTRSSSTRTRSRGGSTARSSTRTRKHPSSSSSAPWAHSHEMHPLARLPLALVDLKIVELDEPLSTTVKP